MHEGVGGEIAVAICDERLKLLVVHVLGFHVIPGFGQIMCGGTDEVIDMYRLIWSEVTRLMHSSLVLDFCVVLFRCRVIDLFPMLTGCVSEHSQELASYRV